MEFFKLHKNIKVRIITSFFTRIVGQMVFPFMAIYFSRGLGATLTGMLLMINICFGIIAGFLGGYLSDKIGRKKIMVWGMVFVVFSYASMAMANSPWFDSVWLTFVMYTIINISSSLSGPATDAMLIDSSTEENRTYMYSLSYWTFNLAVMIGTFLGGFFFNDYRFELFIGLTITSAITLLMIAFVITDDYVPQKVVEKVHIIRDIVNSYKVVVVDKAFMAFTFATIWLWSLEEHSKNYISIRIEKEFKPIDLDIFSFSNLHLDGIKVVGFINTENALMVVVFTMFVAAWIRKADPKKIMVFGILLYTIGCVFLGFSNSALIIFVACIIYTIGEIIYTPVQSTIRAELMNHHARGAYSAITSFGYSIVRLIGALGITLYGWIGSYGMTVFIALSGIVSFLFFRYTFKLKDAQSVTGNKAQQIV